MSIKAYLQKLQQEWIISTAEYVSILIQITDDGYDILNVYFRGRNYKAHGYVSPFRIMLDKVVPQIES